MGSFFSRFRRPPPAILLICIHNTGDSSTDRANFDKLKDQIKAQIMPQEIIKTTYIREDLRADMPGYWLMFELERKMGEERVKQIEGIMRDCEGVKFVGKMGVEEV